MAESGAQSVAVDECMSLPWVGQIAAGQGIGFIGNLRVTPEMGAGVISAREDALVCMSAGGALPGYVFGFGGPLPDDTDPALLSEALAGKAFHEETYPRWPAPIPDREL